MRRRVKHGPRVIAAWILLCLVGASLPPAKAAPTDCQRDLQEIEKRLSIATNALPPSASGTSPIQLGAARAAVLAEKAFLTLAASDLIRARATVDALLTSPDLAPALVSLRAKLCLQLHEVQAAQRDVAWLQCHSPDQSDLAGLRFDLDLEAGDFTEARQIIGDALQSRRDWAHLARQAQLNALLGQVDAADALYREAQDTLTAKQMRAFAWLEVQRGRLQATRGQWPQAEAHAKRADRAYSGLWQVASSRAEADAAQGRTAEAIAQYESLIAETGRPELCQALGDLYRFTGNAAQAKAWHERALAGYLASVERGEVLYLHHLAEFYSDLRPDGSAALKWAQRDFALRPGWRTRQVLSWALYRRGSIDRAYQEMALVLEAGIQDAHLFQQAARVSLAAGQDAEAKSLLAKATALNPRYEGFHVHP